MTEEIKGDPGVTVELKNTIEKTNWWNDSRRDDREKKKKSVKSIELTQSIELLSLNKGEENEKSQRSVVPSPTSSSLPPGAEALL